MSVSGSIADLFVRLKLVDDFSDPVEKATKSAALSLAGMNLTNIGQGFSSAVSDPILGFLKESVGASSDAAEEMEKFGQVFKEMSGEGESWVSKTATEMGRSESMVRSFAATFGAVLTPMMDGNREKALELSEGYTKLAVDLASFNNVSEEVAQEAISSAIAGETEPMRKFGVMLSEAAIQEELLAMGIEKTTKEATDAEKQQARYNIIMKATADAQGDAVRTSGGFANSMRAIGSTVESIQVSLGDALMPVIMLIVNALKAGLDIFDKIPGPIKAIAAVAGVLVAALGPLLVVLGVVVSAMGALLPIIGTVATGGIAAALGGLLAPLGLTVAGLAAIAAPVAAVVAGLAAIGAAIYLLDRQFHFIEPTIKWFKDVLGGIADWFGTTFGPIIEGIAGWFDELGASLGGSGSIVEDVLGWFEDLGKGAAELGKAIGDVLGPALQGFATWFGEAFGPAIKIAFGAIKGLAEFIAGQFLQNIQTTFGLLKVIWDGLGTWFEGLSGGRSVLEVLADGFVILAGHLAIAWQGLQDFAAWLGTTFGPIVQPVLEALGWVGEKLGLAGSAAATETPKLQGAADAIGKAGEAAGIANPGLDALTKNLTNGAGGADALATNLGKATDALKTWDGTQATSLETYQKGLTAGAPPDPSEYASPEGYMVALKEWTKKITGDSTPTTTDAPKLPDPADYTGTTPTITPAQTWTYDDDPSGAKRQSTEGAAEEYVGVTIVEQFQRDGYWWTRWSDGTVTRGPAVQKTPGARGTIPKFHDGGIYDPAGSSSEGLAWLQAGEAVLTPAQQQTVAGAIADGGSNPETVALLKQIAGGIQQLIAATARGTAAVVQAQKSDIDLAQAVAAVQSVRLAQRGGTY